MKGFWLGFCEDLTGLEGREAVRVTGYLWWGFVLVVLAGWAFLTFSDPEFWVTVWEGHEQCRLDPGCQFVQS